jgi:hypothetical protein
MPDKLAKISNILLWVMMSVSAVFIVMLFIDGSDSWISNSLIYTYILAIFATLVALGFGIHSIVMKFLINPKNAIINIAPVIGLIIIVIVAYNFSSGSAMKIPNYTEEISASTIKWTGTGLYVTYTLLILAVVSIIFVEISKFLKK